MRICVSDEQRMRRQNWLRRSRGNRDNCGRFTATGRARSGSLAARVMDGNGDSLVSPHSASSGAEHVFEMDEEILVNDGVVHPLAG